MDRYNALLVFRTIAEAGSFAEAGRRLRLSPPAVSKNVAELEAHVGVRLINRTTRRMALTVEGEAYLKHVVRGLDEFAEAEATLSRAKASPSGLLRVSAPLTVALARFSRDIPAFLSRHADLKLELDLDDRRVDIVRDGFDVVIRGYSSPEDTSLIARKLGTMEHVVCAAPSYLDRHGTPRRPRELADHQLIRFPYGAHADTWDFRKDGKLERVQLKARYSVSSSLAVRDALYEGMGISLIPRPYVEDDIAHGRLHTMLQEWSTTGVTHYAVYPSRHHLAPKVRAFVDFLVDCFSGSRDLDVFRPPASPG